MTRKSPSRTKRELEKLRRRRDGDGEDTPPEIVVELEGVPASGPDEDGGPPTINEGDAFESFSVDLDSGEVETPEFPPPSECPNCSSADCGIPALPEEFGVSSLRKCGNCLGIPARDVPPAFRDDTPEDHA